MKAFVITIMDHEGSIQVANRCIKSAKKNNIQVDKWFATTPSSMPIDMLLNEGVNIAGLHETYSRIANCAAAFHSHYSLWKHCVEINEEVLILEHDAYFIKQIPIDVILEWDYQIIGINDPLGATRKAREFKRLIELDPNFVQNVPSIDEFNVPQGIAGNSAYIITPEGAERCMSAVFKYGLWPNDAIMCKQLVRGMGVTKHHYTRIQGLPSTTT